MDNAACVKHSRTSKRMHGKSSISLAAIHALSGSGEHRLPVRSANADGLAVASSDFPATRRNELVVRSAEDY